ncbi:cation channel sperm-associated protein 1 [Microtus pennsylvanicus]|uniref:cation channel sperm-associated protein 1 n=1 Tax=Microtus pennsylvanicus TaxID=10058 RepID=UPI003F6D71D1
MDEAHHQTTVKSTILGSPLPLRLTIMADFTTQMNPSTSHLVLPRPMVPLLSPTTITDSPKMNLIPTLSPTNNKDSPKVNITIVEVVRLCPTSLLRHPAERMLPTRGDPMNPITKPTTTAGINLLNPNTTKSHRILKRAPPTSPLRGPPSREDITAMAAIIQAPKPPITMYPSTSHSTFGVSPSHMGAKSSVFSVPHSHLTSRSGTSRVSSRIHPKESSKESDSLSEDDYIQKRKRKHWTHKKIRSGNIFQLIWGKICLLIWGLRQMMMSLTQSLGFETFIFIVVCLNTVVLVAQTFTELEIRGEWYFMVLDSIFLSIYVIEAVLKLIALGLEYFYDPWNNLDFFIMVMAVLDFVLIQINSLSYSFYNHSLFRILKVFKSMRALRAIRVLRRLSILTSLHEVTGTLRGSLPSITAILTLMFTCLFLFSVVLRALFRQSDPKRFQNIFTTLFTLFTMLTLDDWSLIYMDSRAHGAWYIIPILMIYIIIQYFIFLNLVIAVLVDNFQMALLKGLEKVKLEKAARVHEKLLDDSLTELNKTDAEAQMSDSALQAQFIERMFSTMTERQRELHFQYLRLVASVEQHQQKFRSQASVIDEIVDTAFEAGEEDFGK